MQLRWPVLNITTISVKNYPKTSSDFAEGCSRLVSVESALFCFNELYNNNGAFGVTFITINKILAFGRTFQKLFFGQLVWFGVFSEELTINWVYFCVVFNGKTMFEFNLFQAIIRC